jgi:hypothetical protein
VSGVGRGCTATRYASTVSYPTTRITPSIHASSYMTVHQAKWGKAELLTFEAMEAANARTHPIYVRRQLESVQGQWRWSSEKKDRRLCSWPSRHCVWWGSKSPCSWCPATRNSCPCLRAAKKRGAAGRAHAPNSANQIAIWLGRLSGVRRTGWSPQAATTLQTFFLRGVEATGTCPLFCLRFISGAEKSRKPASSRGPALAVESIASEISTGFSTLFQLHAISTESARTGIC